MLLFRWIVMLLLVGGILCFAMYIGTRDKLWLRRGVRVVSWALMAALAFFAVLVLERLAVMV